MMWERGEIIGGKDRQAPVDESIMPAPSGPGYITTTWEQVGLTWADIIEQENANGTTLYRDRQLHQR
jgi:hypothetical protein